MQRFVDDVLAVTKESVKTFTYESLNNVVRLINGFSAFLLTIIPGKSSILEGIHGWELRPTFRGPGFPRWMENGVSSFNQFIHDLSVVSDASSSEYTSTEDGDEDPVSPSSQHSGVSTSSAFAKHDRGWIQYPLGWILFPIRRVLSFPVQILRSFFVGSKPGSPHSIRRMQTLRDQIVNRTTDKRRGLVEDLHLVIEITIEAIFDIFRKAAYLLLSPSEIIRTVIGLFSSHGRGRNDEHDSTLDASAAADTSGESALAVSKRNTRFYQSMNTDSRTCQDVITELGYPYEAIHVVTVDGYVLLLERIPRRDARKVVYLQHGVFDSSMGWVSNGIVGSPAFAAYDQGYDVFLGNFRGLVSREHADKNISSLKYWNYSLNELGTKDILAMVEKIHEVKTAELKLLQPDNEEDINENQPYKLCAICHSLGGAAILIHVITRRIQKKPHRLSRLILLSPAGFHDDSNMVFTFMEHLFILLAPVLRPLVPGIYIPTRFFRMLLNKLARDFHNLPAVGGLVQTLVSYVVGGDSSNWVGILGLPHYNMNDMPGVSFTIALHLSQLKRTGRFRMFDYGSPAANMEMYGSPEPVDLGECYGLIDIPVDLVAGRKDNVIRSSMIRKHYEYMRHFGVDVSYVEFEYAHLDFTFSHREELLTYVMSRLLLVDPASKHQVSQRSARLKKKGHATD